MATSKGGRGNKSITKLVEEWVEQGFSATMIKELLKDAGYQKGRISQLLRPLKEFAEATTPEAIPCQRCGFPWCKCKACKQKKKNNQCQAEAHLLVATLWPSSIHSVKGPHIQQKGPRHLGGGKGCSLGIRRFRCDMGWCHKSLQKDEASTSSRRRNASRGGSERGGLQQQQQHQQLKDSLTEDRAGHCCQ